MIATVSLSPGFDVQGLGFELSLVGDGEKVKP